MRTAAGYPQGPERRQPRSAENDPECRTAWFAISWRTESPNTPRAIEPSILSPFSVWYPNSFLTSAPGKSRAPDKKPRTRRIRAIRISTDETTSCNDERNCDGRGADAQVARAAVSRRQVDANHAKSTSAGSKTRHATCAKPPGRAFLRNAHIFQGLTSADCSHHILRGTLPPGSCGSSAITRQGLLDHRLNCGRAGTLNDALEFPNHRRRR